MNDTDQLKEKMSSVDWNKLTVDDASKLGVNIGIYNDACETNRVARASATAVLSVFLSLVIVFIAEFVFFPNAPSFNYVIVALVTCFTNLAIRVAFETTTGSHKREMLRDLIEKIDSIVKH